MRPLKLLYHASINAKSHFKVYTAKSGDLGGKFCFVGHHNMNSVLVSYNQCFFDWGFECFLGFYLFIYL